MKPITVLLAEDHGVVREGMCLLLESSGDFRVVGQATTGTEAVRLAAELRPDVVVMDVAMPELNGCEATRQIVAGNPDARVLALSAHSDEEYVVRLVAVGALGFVAKQSSGTLLARAIRAVADGRAYFSPGIARMMDRARRRAHERGRPGGGGIRDSLTSREMEVLQRVAEGAANKQIAADLGISIKTVEKHRQRLMDKLDIHETAGLTRYAIATGMLEAGARNGSFSPPVEQTSRTNRAERTTARGSKVISGGRSK